MTRFAKLLSFLLIICALPAAAQTGCSQTRTYYFPDPAGIPPGAYNITSGGPFMSYYDIKVACTPPSAHPPESKLKVFCTTFNSSVSTFHQLLNFLPNTVKIGANVIYVEPHEA